MAVEGWPCPAAVTRTAYHRAYYWSRLEARRASARASRRRAREVRAIVKIVCEAVTEARNEKSPPVMGEDLTRAGGWPYSRDAIRSDGTIDRGKRSVNAPLLDARYWENSLKPVGEERGAILKSVQRPPNYGHAAHCREACKANEETRQKLPTPSEAPKGS